MRSAPPIRVVAILAIVPGALVLTPACEEEPVEGELVTCAREWSCARGVVSESTERFCTDPTDDARDARIDAYVAGFPEGCDGVTVTCEGGEVATCVARCGIAGACPIEDAVIMRL